MKKIFLNNFVSRLKKSTNFKNKFVPLHEPTFSKYDKISLNKCLKSTFVSTKGEMVTHFENSIKKITKSKFAIAVINGTCGLQLSLNLLGIQKNDEILVPSLTFIGTVNPIINSSAIPHFVEVEEKTFGIDCDKLYKYLKKKTYRKNKITYNKITKRKISAIIVVHVFGHAANIVGVKKIAKIFNLKVIEDAAECIGSFSRKKHLGTFSDIGVISFNGNKTITTGGGGVVLTQKKNLEKEARHLIQNAKLPHKWEYFHDKVANNFGMPALNASLGYSQLLNIKKIIKNKRKLFEIYKKNFDGFNIGKIIKEEKFNSSNYWLQTFFLHKKYKYLKNDLIKYSNLKKIMTRPLWYPMHKLNFLKSYPRMKLKTTEDIYSRVINLPSSPKLANNK